MGKVESLDLQLKKLRIKEIKECVPGHSARLEPGPVPKGVSITAKRQEFGCSACRPYTWRAVLHNPGSLFPPSPLGFYSTGIQPNSCSWGRRVRVCPQVCVSPNSGSFLSNTLCSVVCVCRSWCHISHNSHFTSITSLLLF